MPLDFMRDTVTVVRPGARESRGSTVPDWDNPSRHVVADVQVTPVSTVQDRDGRVANADDRMRLRCRFDADIKPGDRVVWNGDTYEVDGDVFHVKSPTGRVSSTRCTLALWRG